MTSLSSERQYLYSTLGDDPDLGEIVTEFVEEMPDRIRKIESLAAAADWESLRRCAHQLKGAAGSYGFDPLTQTAAKLEAIVDRRASEEEVLAGVGQLTALCRQVRPGAPS